MALLVWGVAWFTNASALAENRLLIAAIQPQSTPAANLTYFKQALAYGTYGTQEAREQLAQVATRVASMSNVDLSTKQQFFDTAMSEMALQEKASPLDARFPLFQGILLSSFGDSKDAATALARAHQLSPKKQSILYAVAQTQQALGDSAGALKTLGEAYNLEPKDNDARFFYAAAAIALGQDAIANDLLAPLIPTGEAADARIAAAYVNKGRFDKIVEIWDAYVKNHPTDMQGYFTLAAAYYEAKNPAQAIATLQKAEAANPAVKDSAEKLIQEIKDGTVKVGGR